MLAYCCVEYNWEDDVGVMEKCISILVLYRKRHMTIIKSHDK